MININKYYIQELLENLLSQIGWYYKGTKSNKKKIIVFFESLPFFFFNERYQNIIYDIIKSEKLSSYIDNNKDMKLFCYNIYLKFSYQLNLKYKSQKKFYNDFLIKVNNNTESYIKIRKVTYHNIYFFTVIFIILSLYIYTKYVKIYK